ncbi:MAG TPA: acyl-CoA dehydrogenase family protein [Acidimicrobiia bacterium]
MEDLDSFRSRARTFIRANLGPAGSDTDVMVGLRGTRSDAEDLAAVQRDRELQRMLFDAGLAGICFPREYGGQGLSPAHQTVLNEELAGYEYPLRLQAPSISQCGAVILEFGTEEQKGRHLPAILRGDEIWVQFLSEPGGGSDVAGAVTTAVRDGDEWVLNGSKIWTSGAWWSHWGLCLARTNWDVPKHRGLTVFMVPIAVPGLDVHRIELLSGSREFCQEFFTDVRIPDAYRIGDVDDGWTVGIGWMLHERLGPSSSYYTAPAGSGAARPGGDLPLGRAHRDDPVVRDLVGEVAMLELVGRELSKRLAEAMATGKMTDQAAAIGRLFHGVASVRTRTIALELAGDAGVAWNDDDGDATHVGIDYLMSHVATIAGGTTEMARNVISERVLGMPRERALDREVAFRDVPRSAQPETGALP